MPDNIVELLIMALFGAGGAVSYYKAVTERRKVADDAKTARDKVLAEAEGARVQLKIDVEKTASDCWKEFNVALQQRLQVVTDRLTEVENQLAQERVRANRLEEKIRQLEDERDHWRIERHELIGRIAELEGCA